MVITMPSGTIIISFVCLLVFTGASGGPIDDSIRTTEGHNVAGQVQRSQPHISVINYSDVNRLPRQRTFDKQFYSPLSQPDLLRSSNVLDTSSKTFGQKIKSPNSAKPAKHSFYIVTPNRNLKNGTPQGDTNKRHQQKNHNLPVSTSENREIINSGTKQDVSLVIKRDSNRFQVPSALSSNEDVITDAGLLSSFGSSLFSNDALNTQSSGSSHLFGIPLPSSPPINSDVSVFTSNNGILDSSKDIESFAKNLSPQDVTAFTNSLSPEEVTSLTKNLLKSLNIESTDLDGLLNLSSPLLTSGTSTGNSGQIQSLSIPLSNSKSTDTFKSASRTRSSGVSIPRTNSHAFGTLFPNVDSHSSSNNIGKELSFGIPVSSINSDSFGQTQSFGINLPGVNSDTTSINSDVPNFVYGTPSSSSNFKVSDPSHSFGIPLPDLKTNTFSISSGNQANSEQTNSVGLSLNGLNGEGSLHELKSGVSHSADIPVTGLNDIFQTVGIPLPELKSDVSSVGVPHTGLNSGSSSDSFSQTQTFGIPLPGTNQGATFGSHDSFSEASGQSHSSGIPLPGLNSGTFTDGINNVKSVGIPLPGINPDDTGSNFFTPLTVVSEGNTQFSLSKDGNNNILSSSSSGKLSPIYVGTSDDEKKTVTVDVDINTKADPLDNLTIGQLLMGMNGHNGIVVLPMSSLNDVKNNANGLTIVTDSSSEGDEKIVVNISSSDTTTSAPATTTRRARRTTTTTKAPDTFRVTISDLLYSKGQWFGTLLGGMIDYGRIAWDTLQDHLNAQPTYGPTYGSYNSYGG